MASPLRVRPTRAMSRAAQALAAQAAHATAGARNEVSLMHELEGALEDACGALEIPWTPFNLGLALENETTGARRFADVAHGAVVIEYEPPRCFAGRDGATLQHAQAQAAEYATLLQREEGRALGEYQLVAWDGAHVSFGRFAEVRPDWEALQAFDDVAAERLLLAFARDGVPLVHPHLLAALVGPESETGEDLLPRLFSALTARARSPRTVLLFTEWKRLFGQVVGVQSEPLRDLLRRQGAAHDRPYETDPTAYLFALNTYIAIVAKLVAALSLRGASEDLRDRRSPIGERVTALESGELFRHAGIVNMLSGDFFSWYRTDRAWPKLERSIESLLERLAGISFDTARKHPDATRDLFKGMYQSFVPRALRHALGEFYTPDWLAGHALDVIGWEATDDLLDPTCGTGTFLLEALRRRLSHPRFAQSGAGEILAGLHGLDLNPLAVLAARASLVVYLAQRIEAGGALRLPIFLADAVNAAAATDGVYRHDLQTEQGTFTFEVAASVVEHPRFFEIFARARTLIEAGRSGDDVAAALLRTYGLAGLGTEAAESLRRTMRVLAELHAQEWDGIWSNIVAERFAAAAIPRTRFICGNPPWVKWSHLPPEYAAFIKPRCLELGVFSEDRWVGGIESDISTVVTYEAIAKWLAADGTLAFFITATVFANESSQGFRRFHLRVDGEDVSLGVVRVEDFTNLRPFDGVTNLPALLILRRGRSLEYPVTYRVWDRGGDTRGFADGAAFRRTATHTDLLARPVPGTDAGPWLKGTGGQHHLWARFFGAGEPQYRARKGVTTDLNGVFFVRVLSRRGRVAEIRNDPSLGRRALPERTADVEAEHLFPLVRGRGIAPFAAAIDPDYAVLVPQRGMHGDPGLPESAPLTFEYLKRFRKLLEARGSYRRFQRTQAYWSLWSTGPYTFSPYKVLWREMGGGRFAAAYLGPVEHPLLGTTVPVPDHKVYFVPIETEPEAAYLTALLNAPAVAEAIAGYASQLSLGVSVVEYLRIPRFDATNGAHATLAQLGAALSRSGRAEATDLAQLDELALRLFSKA